MVFVNASWSATPCLRAVMPARLAARPLRMPRQRFRKRRRFAEPPRDGRRRAPAPADRCAASVGRSPAGADPRAAAARRAHVPLVRHARASQHPLVFPAAPARRCYARIGGAVQDQPAKQSHLDESDLAGHRRPLHSCFSGPCRPHGPTVDSSDSIFGGGAGQS